MSYEPFKNRHRFQDDIWGQIRLNDLERDVIDTPEFQRLFRTSQMGFVEFVYHTANHTRGAHSIGACRMAVRLMNRLVENTSELHESHSASRPGLYADFLISPAEYILIRLGALLHDISHLPFSHDLERKSHKIFYTPKNDNPLSVKSWYGHYNKHDDYLENPLLFRFVCDPKTSVLARVLQHYSARFWRQLKDDAAKPRHHHIQGFVEFVLAVNDPHWQPTVHLLPELLFHLLVFEKPEDAKDCKQQLATTFHPGKNVTDWHLGPDSLSADAVASWHEAWYQPFRHDIIGNTLSADLIDYLTRDPQRLGTQRRIDLHLLTHYVLVNPHVSGQREQYRCAIDLHDYKRGTTRTFLLNDLFRLLDLRHDIHEKAVMHRVVQSANAMLTRGLLLLGKKDLPGKDRRPQLREVAGLAQDQHHALQSEDIFFHTLLEKCAHDAALNNERRALNDAHRIFEKLIERRICRPLVIIPGHIAKDILPFHVPRGITAATRQSDFKLRTLAAIMDSAYYSPFLLFACTCVEKYLLGIFDSDEELCRYAATISAKASNDVLFKRAQNLVSSRVITWAAPYKQLYKDPAIVIALDGFVDQIDRIGDAESVPDDSARDRIEAAIHDADSKYESLWQLYVFISDGLYYSGVLAKFFDLLPPACLKGRHRDRHDQRLKKSQILLLQAFKAICNNWGGQDQNLPTLDKKKDLLNRRMDGDAFKEVITVWLGFYKEKSALPKGWTTVDTKQYSHGYALDPKLEDKLKRPCRDTRYKYDDVATALWNRASADSNSDGFKMIEFLRACHIDNSAILSEREFLELVELYKDEEVNKLCSSLLADSKTDQTIIPEALKALWLGGFPWESTAPDAKHFPLTEEEIAAWLKIHSRVLRPNVQRRLTEDLNPVVNILHWAIPEHGEMVLDDFKERLDNEATLIWNDVRSDHIAQMLRRKWNYQKADARAKLYLNPPE